MDSGHIWQRDGDKKWYCLACGYRLAVRPIPQCKGPVRTCANCGHQRHLHCGPNWPMADGACVMCEKDCKRYAAPAEDAAAPNGLREEAAGEAVAE